MHSIKSDLYSKFYCLGSVAPDNAGSRSYDLEGVASFVQTLSDANVGDGYWEKGWTIVEQFDRLVAVRAQAATLWSQDDDVQHIDVPDTTAIGLAVRLHHPKELTRVSPGFYMAVGNAPMTKTADDVLVRYYWNLGWTSAAHLVNELTLRLNKDRVPFNLKVVNSPAAYSRCDAAVLYVRKADVEIAHGAVLAVYPTIGFRGKEVPVFTKALAPGLGLAEDPGDGESFGMHRCRLLAEGMVRAFEQNRKGSQPILLTVEAVFEQAGISLRRPYLSPGSFDCYAPLECVRPGGGPGSALGADPDRHGQPPLSDCLHDVAMNIGGDLVRSAIWHGNSCNWLAFESDEEEGANRYRALTADVYSGSSGVALFLGELAGVTGDPSIRRTALGAVHHALTNRAKLPEATRIGFFTGWLGIGYVAIRLGALLQQEWLVTQGNDLIRSALSTSMPTQEYDLLSGSAGAIAALVTVSELLNDGTYLEPAMLLGDRLLGAAGKSKAGYSWPSHGIPTWRNLTGFSHGTAGIGYALMRLWRVTDESRYRHAAEQAFSYERHLFDRHMRNWPDFRKAQLGGRRKSFTTAWCHGSAGIALSRLYALSMTNDPAYWQESIDGLRTTRDDVLQCLGPAMGRLSLCHGLTGNAEVLEYGADVLGREAQWGHEVAYSAASCIAEQYRDAQSYRRLQSEPARPGLMLGQTGVGYYFLRLFRHSVPSVLLLGGTCTKSTLGAEAGVSDWRSPSAR